MVWILILLYVYSLILPITHAVVSTENTYCRFPDLQTYPSPLSFPTINTAEYNANCLYYPSFNATIRQGQLSVKGCANAEFKSNIPDVQWQAYSTPVSLKNGQSVLVRCDGGEAVLMVNPPMIEPEHRGEFPSTNPSVFVVMIDAVSYEALHRLLPNTVDMLKSNADIDVYEFTKYSTVGLNSNPNKFAMFGRYDYHRDVRTDPSTSKMTWLWDYAKKLGYTTVVAEDDCPRQDAVWDLMHIPTRGNKVDPALGPDFVLLDQVCIDDPHPNRYCIKGKWGFEYVSDYVSGMLHNFEEQNHTKPIFMWSNVIDAHEPDQWAAPLMDNSVVNYLQTIIKSKFMDNGIILFVSDHGIHFGDFAYSSALGSAENKHPFLYVLAKKGLLNNDILTANKDKLITPNDIYQTLSTLIGNDETRDARDINFLSTRVPADRTCDMAGIPHPFCLCSYGPTTCSTQMPSHIWEVCEARYAHPRFFDWKYYAENQLKPKFGRDFGECEATAHWCSFGLSLGWNGTSHSTLREYVAQSPLYSSHAFCWNWPGDCNWGHIMEHYFTQGFLTDQ